MKHFLVILFVMAVQISANAGSSIYFHIVNDNKSYTFMNIGSSTIVSTTIRDVAMLMLDKPFDADMVDKNYYQVSITHGISWNNEKVTQYDYKALAGDRFRNIFWLTPDKKFIVKYAIIDTNNNIMFDAICMDKGIPLRAPSEKLEEAMSSGNISYKGFINVRTETGAGGMLKMLFSDGLNQISVFRSPMNPKEKYENKQLILYGNYVLNKIIGDFNYTAVGTLPFNIMEELVGVVDKKAKNNEINRTVDEVPDLELESDILPSGSEYPSTEIFGQI